MAVQAQLYPDSFDMPIFGSQDWMVGNPVEADFRFPFFQDSQRHNFSLQQQKSQTLGFHCNRVAWPPSSSSSLSSTCEGFHGGLNENPIDMQTQEVDSVLQLHHERLRSALQQKIKQQFSILLKNVKSKTMNLMRQKEDDLAKATKKSKELEAYLEAVHTELELWQRLAKENETMVINLTDRLIQVRRLAFGLSSSDEDTESSFCGSRQEEEEDRSRTKMACKGCNSRVSCVIFLPCRHLCSCKTCEAFFSSCPVCESMKEGSMEIFLA